MDASVTFLLETTHSSFSSEEDGADEPGDGVFVGEDADDVGPAWRVLACRRALKYSAACPRASSTGLWVCGTSRNSSGG